MNPNNIPEDRIPFTCLKFLFSLKFLDSKIKIVPTKYRGKIFGTFILCAFSLGRIDDKIINIMRIPPVNRMKKIRGNQVDPVSIFKWTNMIDVVTNTINLAFIGFFEFSSAIAAIKIPKVSVSLIIFLSLKKNFSFGD